MQKYGGISRYFYEIIQRLAKTDTVSVFGGMNENGYGVGQLALADYRAYPTPPAIPHTGLGRLRNYANPRLFRRYARQRAVDIYHPTYYDDLHIARGKIVVTVYDMIHELFPDEFGVDNETTRQKKRLLQRADGIIAISEWTKKDLIEIFHIPEEKIRVIYLANSLSGPSTQTRLIPEHYLLYVGNRNGYKNFARVLHAFAQSSYRNDIRLVCFGGGAFRADEQALLHRLHLDRRVTQLGGSDDVLRCLYTYAEAFIYPSVYEGFGLPPLEAMRYHTPVLASNASCIPEVVGDAGLYFDPLSVDAMQSQIDACLSDAALRQRLIERGIQREQVFSWKRCAAETRQYYQDILQETHA